MSCPLPSSSFSHRTNTLRDSLASFDRGAQISRLATPQNSELDDSTSKLLFIHSTFCLNRTGESSSRPMPSLGSCWCNFGRASDENLETIVSFHWDFVNTAVGLLVPGFPQSWKIAKHDHIKTCGPESSFSSPQPGPLWQLEVVCPHRPPASQPQHHQPRIRPAAVVSSDHCAVADREDPSAGCAMAESRSKKK